MKTMSVKDFDIRRGGNILLLICGLIFSAVIDSLIIALIVVAMAFFIQWRINKMWVYVGDDDCIIGKGEVPRKAGSACYVRRSDLPAVYHIVCLRGEAWVMAELFVSNLTLNKGLITPLSVTVVVEKNEETIYRYYECFIRDKQKVRLCIYELLKVFQTEQHPKDGVFGEKYATQVGSKEWINHVFQPKLTQFLVAECRRVGLQVKVIAITPGNEGRSILREVREV